MTRDNETHSLKNTHTHTCTNIHTHAQTYTHTCARKNARPIKRDSRAGRIYGRVSGLVYISVDGETPCIIIIIALPLPPMT